MEDRRRDLVLPPIERGEHGRETGLVARVDEAPVGGERPLDGGEVAGLDRGEELCGAHPVPPGLQLLSNAN